jgi:hypothetical protein
VAFATLTNDPQYMIKAFTASNLSSFCHSLGLRSYRPGYHAKGSVLKTGADLVGVGFYHELDDIVNHTSNYKCY